MTVAVEATARKPRKSGSKRVLLVCSHGGHLYELRLLTEAWTDHAVSLVSVAGPQTEYATDTYWLPALRFSTGRSRVLAYAVAVARIVLYLVPMVRLFRRVRPHVVISNGSEIAIPAFAIARLLSVPTVFIEVYTRVEQPTITGRVLHRWSSLFYVLWPELNTAYGDRARYAGGLL
jgi:beta-1,4-N-acetylglucosaminyltransferase